MGDLSTHFSRHEFLCKCGCGEAKVSPALVELLEDVREFSGVPIQITSGYRCPEYNAKVGGVQNSAHTTGEAADIFVSGNLDRFLFLEAAFTYGARRIGIGNDFIHLDIDMTKPQEVCWLYGAKE